MMAFRLIISVNCIGLLVIIIGSDYPFIVRTVALIFGFVNAVSLIAVRARNASITCKTPNH
jgi:hypothetical protein